MIQLVNGKDFVPGDARGETVFGDSLILNGSALMPPWAYAVYTAPLPPRFNPSQITLYLASISGVYDVGLWDWFNQRWNYVRNQTSPIFTSPIASVFWSVHVYGDAHLTVVRSEFEAIPA